MEKLKFETPDMVAGSIEKIGALFPAAITEMRGEDGQIKKGINFEVLKQLLSRDVVDGDECYEFTWVGKKAAMAEAARPITKTLRPVKEDSRDWDTTQNLYIEGDNLEVLKILQESYLGKVKMIYIDPPYNTGHDFIYRDRFQRSQQEENEQMGMYDEEENQMFENTESNGRFHSDWCSYIYRPLILSKNLLSQNGVIFISIDDHEYENLKRICDDTFGASNYIATIIRNTNSSKNQSLFVSVSHEYCIVYAKDIESLKQKYADNKWSVPKNNVDEYVKKVKYLKDQGLSEAEITEELKELTKYPRFIDFTNYWYFDERGLYRKGDLGGVKNGNMTPLYNPLTGNEDPVPPGGFRFNPEKLAKLVKENRIHFHTDGSLPTIKRYLHENLGQRPKSIMSDDQRPDHSMMQEFNTPFDNPKQLAFIKRIISIADHDSIILDFFSGSATTAHAVMQLNAEDGGHRKFIMVQWPELCAEGTEAANAGYKNICEIGKERIRRARDKIKADNPQGTQDLDTGFRVFRVDSSNMKDVYYQPDELDQQSMFDLVSNIKDDRTDLDLLYACLLDWGVEIHLPHSSTDLDGCTVHNVDNGALMACFSPNVPRSVVEYMAKQQPLRAVFRDSAFASDDAKINVTEIFKNLSPDTKVKVI
ncbi:site-specific DNA-methyltransferase [Flavonifractor sp. An91]|uniref:site-specific DNA-methyltransferase n=1 Tax=Flavonifractor sp. An91 TaxID=1965665 RepID=UPI000B391633|nr:site-specific DNA-methyltransferase [Flavonifractor sp. An91]OUN14683.1 site-specific DNA-methyltransferase [Flavonifractor sp. An91]